MKKRFLALLVMSANGCIANPGYSATIIDACSQKKLVKVDANQKLKVKVNVRSAEHLLVSVNGKSYLVRDSSFQSRFLSYNDENQFSFTLRDLTGRRWTDSGVVVEEKIFDGPAEYDFFFSDNLETEPDNSANCSIRIKIK